MKLCADMYNHKNFKNIIADDDFLKFQKKILDFSRPSLTFVGLGWKACGFLVNFWFKCVIENYPCQFLLYLGNFEES